MPQTLITDHFSCNKSCNKTSAVSILNMATTTPMNLSIKGPEIYDGNENMLENFIKEFDRYSNLIEIPEEKKMLLVTVFLSPEARDKYEITEGENYVAKLRSAFSKKKNLLDMMGELYLLKLNGENPEKIFKMADQLIEKITEKKIGKKELSNQVYMNLIDSYEIKKEVVLKGISEAKDIKDVVLRMDKLKKMDPIDSMAAYNSTQRGTQRQSNEWNTVAYKRRSYPYDRNNCKNEKYDNNRIKNSIEYSKKYQKENFDQKRHNVRCWACHEDGHLRRDCPNVKCSFCQRKGHFRSQCHQNENRFKERQDYFRRNRRDYQRQRFTVAEMNCEDENFNSAGRTEYPDEPRQKYFNGEMNRERNSENEDARSQGEMISVLQ